MSLTGRMREQVAVYRRTARESDAWTEERDRVPAMISEPSADSQKRELGSFDPTITHVARMPEAADDWVDEGDRLRDHRNNLEWLVKRKRLVTNGERHLKVWLSKSRPATQV